MRINVLSPGAVDTPSLRIALTGSHGADQVQAQVNEMGEGNPTGRLADPREMGKAAVFLSSDAVQLCHRGGAVRRRRPGPDRLTGSSQLTRVIGPGR